MDYLIEHVRQGIMLGLLLSMPSILTAAAVGLIIGILQAVTQVQEQTISAVPKMIIVFLIIIITGSTMLEMAGGYIRDSVNLAFQHIPSTGDYLMPPKPRQAGYATNGKNTVYTLQDARALRNQTQASKRSLEPQ
jgi:flagellar biosynthesis protein FliQ